MRRPETDSGRSFAAVPERILTTLGPGTTEASESQSVPDGFCSRLRPDEPWRSSRKWFSPTPAGNIYRRAHDLIAPR